MPSQPQRPLDRAAAIYIRERAARIGITKAEIARKAGISVDSLRWYWDGNRSMTAGTFEAILAALSVNYIDARPRLQEIIKEIEGTDPE